MSYLGPSRSKSTPSATAFPALPASQRAASRAEPSRETDWQQVAVFGAGMALGIVLGAGIALLAAPQPGEETRADLRRTAKRTTRALGRRSRNAWLDLQDELRSASDSLRRRKARRSAERARRRELEHESRG